MDVPSKKPRDAQEYEREETPPADSDPVRKYCVGKLSALLKPMFTQYYAPTEGEEEEEGDRIERVIGAFVTELEMALYKTYGENDKHGKLAAGQKYKYVPCFSFSCFH